ncbi:hypothetical protein QBC35DRAFT_122221 [Podospora australis]|uniref:Uncharacterized protein n=1 Tax=Podospora australis TaxID=1536484 RepID=A0AAN6WX32_9PEZI|nr:hypothetical protein QBC35DRAFT_122221 [Podospora australis]
MKQSPHASRSGEQQKDNGEAVQKHVKFHSWGYFSPFPFTWYGDRGIRERKGDWGRRQPGADTNLRQFWITCARLAGRASLAEWPVLCRLSSSSTCLPARIRYVCPEMEARPSRPVPSRPVPPLSSVLPIHVYLGRYLPAPLDYLCRPLSSQNEKYLSLPQPRHITSIDIDCLPTNRTQRYKAFFFPSFGIHWYPSQTKQPTTKDFVPSWFSFVCMIPTPRSLHFTSLDEVKDGVFFFGEADHIFFCTERQSYAAIGDRFFARMSGSTGINASSVNWFTLTATNVRQYES